MAGHDLCTFIARRCIRNTFHRQQALTRQRPTNGNRAPAFSDFVGTLPRLERRINGFRSSPLGALSSLSDLKLVSARHFSGSLLLQRKVQLYPPRVVARTGERPSLRKREEPIEGTKSNVDVRERSNTDSHRHSQQPLRYDSYANHDDAGYRDRGLRGTYRMTENNITGSEPQSQNRRETVDDTDRSTCTNLERGLDSLKLSLQDDATEESTVGSEDVHEKMQRLRARLERDRLEPDFEDSGEFSPSRKNWRREKNIQRTRKNVNDIGSQGGDKNRLASSQSSYAAEKKFKQVHLQTRTGRNNFEMEFGETVSADLMDVKSEKHKGKEKRQGSSQKASFHKDTNNRIHDMPTTARYNDLLYGISPCLLALLQQRRDVHQVFMTTSFKGSARSEVKQILDITEDRGLRVWTTGRAVLDRLSKQRPHQGICMEVSRLPFHTPDAEEPSQDASLILVLDQIKDPMNLGALLRSAYFLGVDEVIVSKKNCCSLTPVVSKASSGVMEVLPVHATRDVPLFLQEQQSRGWSIVGASMGGAGTRGDVIPCHEYKRSSPLILVIGSEGFGLSRDIQSICSEFISIPAGRHLHPGIDSLNVSVATGILLHSLLGRT